MRVVHLERQPLPNVAGRNSIERLFSSIRGALPPGCSVSVVHCPTPAHGPFWLLKGLLRAWRGSSEVNHIVGDIHYAALALPGRRTILTVHDTLHLERLRGLRGFLYRRLYFTWPLKRCAAITAISTVTRERLIREFPAVALKIRVIPDCPPADFSASPRTFNAACPTILQVGAQPHKNLERLAAALKGIPCRLKIIGPLTGAQRDLLDSLGIAFENGVNLTDREMRQAYLDADLVVFVSLAEGFGMPIIEAQAIGRPLVTSGIEPMAGIAGEGACLVDPWDIRDIRRGILELIGSESSRTEAVAKGLRNARRYTPQAVAACYADLYREISGPGAKQPCT